MAGISQPGHQRVDLGLQKRFAAGQLDQRATEAGHFRHDLVQGHGGPLVEGVRRIAPDAAGIADGGADEDARQARKGRFTLHAAIDFMDQELPRRLVGQQDKPLRFSNGHTLMIAVRGAAQKRLGNTARFYVHLDTARHAAYLASDDEELHVIDHPKYGAVTLSRLLEDMPLGQPTATIRLVCAPELVDDLRPLVDAALGRHRGRR